MAKISKHEGPSYTDDELVGMGESKYPRIRRAELGVVDRPLVGNNSDQLLENTQSENDKLNPSHPQPAPTMGNPSKPSQGEPDSSAPTTDGNTPKTVHQQSAKRATPAKLARTRRVSNTDF